MWRQHSFEPKDFVWVQGDMDVPPTRWWAKWYLVLFVWKTIVTFRMPRGFVGHYYVGYKDCYGEVWTKGPVQYAETFSMRVGREPCEFFAMVYLEGGRFRFIPIEEIARSTLH